MWLKNIFVFSILIISCLSSFAQKKVLDHSVYDDWKSITSVDITDDGLYSGNIINAQEGDNALSLQNLKTGKIHVIPRAYSWQFTPDQKYAVVLVKASYDKIKQLRIKKTAEEKMPKDTLVIVDLSQFSEKRIPNVKSFKLGRDFSDYLAYTLADSIKSPKGLSLVMRHLDKQTEDTLKQVAEYVFSRNGKVFAATIQPEEKDTIIKTGVLRIDLNSYDKKLVSSGKKEYKNLALPEDGGQMAFLATTDNAKTEIKEFKLYYYTAGSDSARLLVDKNTSPMAENWFVSENYTPQFSKSGKRLLFGTAPIPMKKDTTIADLDKVSLDIWHWNEPDIQPKQLKDLANDRRRSYIAYLETDNTGLFYQLATEDIPSVRISDENDGRFALGTSGQKYRLERQWNTQSKNDFWIMDLGNHTKKMIKSELSAYMNFSPKGKYLAWYNYDDSLYYACNVETGVENCLTVNMNVNFWNELNDVPASAGSYGSGFWYENDDFLVVYDKYDMWKLDPANKIAPQNLTNSRENEITLRYVNTDPEKRFVTGKDVLLLSAFNNISKENGYYELKKGKLQPLVMYKGAFSDLKKAKDKDIFAYVRASYSISPDLYVTADKWKNQQKLTDINPQMRDYNWSTVELIGWTSFDGQPAQGLLYKPENFDPSRKYPVITYFYERNTDLMYRYTAPAPSRSVVNIPFFCSNGYIVFVPDIKYTVGHPGKSAYNYIVSGVKELCKQPWVDAKNIGAQGQSWGGYQTAYLVTCTDVFKAAWAGAPVANMFSAYGGIRWSTGISRQFQYEKTQSRIGPTIWEAPELYTENSPIFFADKVNTPLVIMHNDNDGAVPWYQGIEMFMGLRRLGKPVWMLQYNGEDHNLVQRKNCKDLTIRLQQFFDHYLKGAPAPVWMEEGVPAIKKGYTMGLEIEE